MTKGLLRPFVVSKAFRRELCRKEGSMMRDSQLILGLGVTVVLNSSGCLNFPLIVEPCITDENCEGENPCLDHFCDSGLCYWEYNSLPCDDGDVCTTDDVCSEGVCAGIPLECPVGEQCNDEEACGPLTAP